MVSYLKGFPNKICMHFSSLPFTPVPAHLTLLGLIISAVWWREQIVKLFSMQFFQPPVTFSILGPNIPLSTLLSDTLSLCSSLNVRDQVSHPYKTTGNFLALYILMNTINKSI
jgi:hypothetical protein